MLGKSVGQGCGAVINRMSWGGGVGGGGGGKPGTRSRPLTLSRWHEANTVPNTFGPAQKRADEVRDTSSTLQEGDMRMGK